MSPPTAPVSLPPCPNCANPAPRWLEFTSTINKIDTFQCLACGQVWTVGPTPPAAT
jgi:hypothetical protein